MKVFVSYSLADVDLLRQVVETIRAGGDEPLCWDTAKVPGQEVWKSIFGWIDSADLVVVVITDKAVSRAMSIGQEVGHANAKAKPIVPLVSSDVKPGDLGCLSGVIYQPIGRENTQEALASVASVISKMKLKKEEEQRQLLVLGGIVALFLLVASNG